MIKFYKGVLISDLTENYIPGTVTLLKREAVQWKNRIDSNKKKGATNHIRHGKSCLIEISYDGKLGEAHEFQESGVKEHSKNNCWTSLAKNKAQINTVCKYRIMSEDEEFCY